MMQNLPLGIRYALCCLPPWTTKQGRIFIFIATFIIYTAFHLSRKPISVVKSVLHSNCTEQAANEHKPIVPENASYCDWKPFDGDNSDFLFGALDLVYLGSYAVFMFFSGYAADRFHLRHYLTVGCLLAGLSTSAFGLGYFLDIHSYAYYVIVQLAGGAFQAMGWPAVVACIVNWFGKSRRGLFMGVWTAHTSLGNILGSVIAGAVVSIWGWSFVLPGLIIMFCGVLTHLFLLPYPEELNLHSPERPVIVAGTVFTVENHSRDGSSVPNLNTPGQPNLLSQTSVSSEENEIEYSDNVDSSTHKLTTSGELKPRAVSLCDALRVPGVIEYSLSLFFAKLVSYTFLFWLPNYIQEAGHFLPSSAADLSAIFDIGGLIGGILAGFFSDYTSASASVCVVMFTLGVPVLYIFSVFGVKSVANCISLLIPLGILVNGPYALITTAVSADLGTHPTLHSDTRALATIAGIIDGTGSVGAMLGPLLCGLLKPLGWLVVFIMLMVCLVLSILFLSRRVYTEFFSYLRTPHSTMEEPVL